MISHENFPNLTPEERLAIRAQKGAARPLQRASFYGHGTRELRFSAAAEEYFQLANVRFLELRDTSLLTAHIATFRDVRFVHATLPEGLLIWPRDSASLQTVTLIFMVRGNIDVITEGVTLSRDPGVTLIPPGTSHVRFRSTEPENEAIYLSIDRSLVADIMPESSEPMILPALDAQALKPILSFIASTCAVTEVHPSVASALEGAANEVTRSALLATFGPKETPAGLYSRTHEYVLRHYADLSLTIAKVAKHFSVSTRTIQLALQEAGTSFTQLVQQARTIAALELRSTQPSLKLSEVARRSGFGSLSSLHRALRAVRAE